MKRLFTILLLVLLLSPPLFAQEEEVSWEEEEQQAAQQQAGQDKPKLLPLPEIVTSNWALIFPGACLALVAWNVGWRKGRRQPKPRPGGSDD